MVKSRRFSAVVGLTVTLAGSAALAIDPGYGPNPSLPKPDSSLIPTVQVFKAKGWEGTASPKAADGLKVARFATGLDHPRWLLPLPNGDVLVAESNGPGYEKPEGFMETVRARVQGFLMRRVGATAKTANRITLLRDADGDGAAETKTLFLKDLNSPFGMAIVGNDLYVANTDNIMHYKYTEGQTSITEAGDKLTDLPALPRDHHWTKNIIASEDGTKLYATVGSNSNVAEHGMEIEEGRAMIWEIDRATGQKRPFATGLRNPNGLAWEPETKALWTVVNERDELGNDLVPDYLTSVKDGAFYGWPYSYFGQNVDTRVEEQKPELVKAALAPDYGLGAHTANLGLTFYSADLLPAKYKGGAFIGQHGSWNRKPAAGYRVIYVPFANGKPNGMPEEILTGFLTGDGEASGRPVGVVVDNKGALLVADDVGNVVWRVTPAK